ncbi:MAG TPA: ATP-binding cassette domain-containing protein, partial [Anaerolineae bacterium]|nr:ATP-binding cassette domain-containing protein [Anaerolineae bacterium]
MNSESSLQVEQVSLSFGGTAVLNDINFDVRKGEIRAIIGPNGAGKTSMLNCISGFYRPQTGRVMYGDDDLTQMPTHNIAPLGIARTFQNIALYTGLSTLDNLMAARQIYMRQGMLASM